MDRRDLRPLLLALALLLSTLLTPARQAVAAEDPPKLLGQCTAAQLAEEPYAEWFDTGYAQYTPDPEVVEALRRVDRRGLEIAVFFGTWCGDSRREVPRMLKLLDTLGFPESDRRLIAVDNTSEQHKRSPDGEEEGLEIYRVPTFVVSRGGQEISRIVEYPALSLERDLLAILEGGGYQASYASYPVVQRWLREGLLADANVSAGGLANQVRSLVSSESELYSTARVLLSRGDVEQAVKLFEVNCSMYWESASCHARLADAQAQAGDLERARASALRALRRNDDPDRIEKLVELIERTASPSGPMQASGAVDVESLEGELRATETAFAAAFAAGDMEAFADFVAEEAVFFASDNPLRGKEAILTAWRGYRGDGDEPPFTWRPERVAIEAGGSHGLSTGPVHAPDGSWTATFVSTWKRTDQGWRIILDVGARCPPSAAPSED